MTLDDDPELAELLRLQRSYTVRRALIFGLVSLGAAVAGVLGVLYGRSLEAAQAHSEVVFLFPSRLIWVGSLVAVVGTLGAFVSFVTGIRLGIRDKP